MTNDAISPMIDKVYYTIRILGIDLLQDQEYSLAITGCFIEGRQDDEDTSNDRGTQCCCCYFASAKGGTLSAIPHFCRSPHFCPHLTQLAVH